MVDSNRSRLLYLITLPELGGAQSHVLDLVTGFRQTYEVHLATSSPGPLTAAVGRLGIPVHLLPTLARSINPLSDLRCVIECTRLLQSVQPSLLHAHSSKAGLIGRIAGRLARVPVVFTAHGWGFTPGVPRNRRWIVRAAEARVARFTASTVCVSHFDRLLAEKHGIGTKGPGSLVAIHYGIAEEGPSALPEKQPPTLLMTARFNEQKDPELLLKAFAEVGNRGARLAFAGSGPKLSKCQALAARLGLQERVDFLGDRTDVPDLLAQAQVFVLTTHYEGLPLSILEAMRAGLPVIASDVSGVSEEVEHGVTGFLIPRGDLQTAAAALDKLIGDPALRCSMGAAGRRKFLNQFTLRRMLEETEAVYRKILVGRQERRF